MNKHDVLRFLVWLIAIVATVSSLILSEYFGFVPCELCWYQRIVMYPLIVIAGIGFYKRDSTLHHYVLPFGVIGTFVALIHYIHQKTSLFASTIQCSQGIPCSGEYINWFGFMTIPLLSFIAFLLITILSILSKQTDQQK